MQTLKQGRIVSHSFSEQNYKSISFFNFFRLNRWMFLLCVFLVAGAVQAQQESNYSSLTAPVNRLVLLDPPPEPSGGSGVEPGAVGEQVWAELKDFAGPESAGQLLRSDRDVPFEPSYVLTPLPQIGFNGVINSPVTGTPPDTHIAAGPGLGNAGRVIMVTNGHLQIWDKTGSIIASPVLLDTVFGSNCFDPKVLYDQHSGRFFIVCLEGSTPNPGGTSNIHIAVSSNGTPNNLTSDWTFMVGSGLTNVGGHNTWSDYPGIGADGDSLFITVNLFGNGGSYRGMKIRVFNKAYLISGSYTYVDIDYNDAVTFVSTTQPAHVYGTTDNGGFYLISRLNSSTYRIFNITGDPATPVAATSTHSWSGGTYPSDTGADQLGTTVDLDTLSSRVMNAVYRNGHIWLCLTSNPDNDGETEVVWQDITTNGGSPSSPSVYQSGYIDGTGSTPWTYMPSINVNSSGDAAICYTQSSTSQYADVVYTMRLSSDALGTFQSPVVARAGTGYYDSFSSSNPDRWGDYSGCVVDPTTDCFWIANEFAWSSAPANSAWATYIANFCSVSGPKSPDAFDATALTESDTPIVIILEASDDGLPDPPGIMDFIITALPNNGTLSEPDNGFISSIPYTLVNNGNSAVYTPDNCYNGVDSFQFKANDGGTPPDGGDSNIATISITVTPNITNIFSEDFESGLGGFTINNSFGDAGGLWYLTTACNSTLPNHSGPTALYYSQDSDSVCNYAAGQTEGVVTSPVISLAGASAPITLEFNYLLETENYSGYDIASVEISENSGPFTEFLSNNAGSLLDPGSSWVLGTVDLSSMAGANVEIRFRFRTVDSLYNNYDGFYVDDVIITSQGPESVGDLNCDDKIDNIDFSLFAIEWFNSGCIAPDWCNGADLTENGDVGIPDLQTLIDNWLDGSY